MNNNLITALKRSLEDECTEIENNKHFSYEFSEKFEKKMNKLIKRREKPYYTFICTAGRRAACIVLALFVISASTLSVKAVREEIYSFIVNHFSDHDVLALEPQGDGPNTIEEEYCLTRLPDGYEEADRMDTDDCVFVTYNNGDTILLFGQYTKTSFRTYVDNENTDWSNYTDDNGLDYRIGVSSDNCTIIWQNDKYVFEVSGNLDKDELLSLCKSTKIKE